MRYKLLGRSGLRVSELCLGAMTFGQDWGWGANKEESQKIYHAFLEKGGNFIDTADLYTNGTSETFVGEFMVGHREHIVLATKYTNSPRGQDPNAAGNHRKNMVQSVEASLRRLKTDYIDLYWLHTWEYTTPMEEVLRAFDDLVSQGKVLYIGISDAPAWVISRGNTMADFQGWTPFIAIQIQYNLVQRTVERELLPMARELDLGVLAWGPLASGLLTGKYSEKGAQPANEQGRIASSGERPPIDDRKANIIAAVVEVAHALGRSPSQVALAWLRQQPGIVIPIVGARKLSQLEDNMGCLDLTLADEHMKKLDETSAIEAGFPHDFFRMDRTLEHAFGGMESLIDNHRS